MSLTNQTSQHDTVKLRIPHQNQHQDQNINNGSREYIPFIKAHCQDEEGLLDRHSQSIII